MIDIDYFKNYNDFYGHLSGDDVLMSLGHLLLNEIAADEYYAIRFGGEEFIIILPDCNVKNSIEIAKKLLKSVRNLKIKHEKSLISDILSVSIGISTINEIIIDEKILCIKVADEALYLAKERGRNTFIHYEKKD